MNCSTPSGASSLGMFMLTLSPGIRSKKKYCYVLHHKRGKWSKFFSIYLICNQNYNTCVGLRAGVPCSGMMRPPPVTRLQYSRRSASQLGSSLLLICGFSSKFKRAFGGLPI